jgi:AraC-like DNA-binding protein
MDYREHGVRPPLDAMVECVWFLRGDGRHADPLQRVLPDGCIELVFHFGHRFAWVSADGAHHRQDACVVAGMLTAPLVLVPPDDADTMGVRFRPGCAYRFLRVPLSELTDRTIGLDCIWGSSARRLEEELGAARGDGARLAIVTRVLTERLSATAPDERVASAVRDLIRSAGRADVATIARRAGVTERHLQRRFADRVGINPKLLARILRFQNTLRQRTASTPLEWARVAVDCGYFDQSHLIRDYAALAGDTPASLRAAEGWLSSYFTAPHRLGVLLGDRR